MLCILAYRSFAASVKFSNKTNLSKPSIESISIIKFHKINNVAYKMYVFFVVVF